MVVMLAGCATTQTRWGEWQTGTWSDSGERSVCSVTVRSTPSGAEVYVDGRRHGTTPTTLRLDYPIEARLQHRSLNEDRTTSGGETASALVAIASLGLVNEPAPVHRHEINRDVRRETRPLTKTYAVSIGKAGYFTRSFRVSAPEDEGRVIQVSLRAQEVLWIEPVRVVEAIQRETGVFRWLQSNIFARNAIRRDQYPALADRVGAALQANLADTGSFLAVRHSRADALAGAVLHAQVELADRVVVIQGELASPGVLGARRVTRRVEIPDKEFLAKLYDLCDKLSDALMDAYLAAVAEEASN